MRCFLCGGSWIFKFGYYFDDPRFQRVKQMTRNTFTHFGNCSSELIVICIVLLRHMKYGPHCVQKKFCDIPAHKMIAQRPCNHKISTFVNIWQTAKSEGSSWFISWRVESANFQDNFSPSKNICCSPMAIIMCDGSKFIFVSKSPWFLCKRYKIVSNSQCVNIRKHNVCFYVDISIMCVV